MNYTKTSDKVHVFENSKIIGDEGEKIIKDFLNSLPIVHRVVDMANNKLFYHKDVDFVVQMEDGKKLRSEIKTDTYTSGNIYYETMSNQEYKVEGCMQKTDCDYLFYYFIKFDKLYILKMDKYKALMERLIKENHPALQRKSVKNQKTNYISHSIGYTFPLCVLEEMMAGNGMIIVKDVKKKTYNL